MVAIFIDVQFYMSHWIQEAVDIEFSKLEIEYSILPIYCEIYFNSSLCRKVDPEHERQQWFIPVKALPLLNYTGKTFSEWLAKGEDPIRFTLQRYLGSCYQTREDVGACIWKWSERLRYSWIKSRYVEDDTPTRDHLLIHKASEV